MKTFKASLRIKSDIKLNSLCEQVETEICRLEKENILVTVSHSEWAAPIVVVHKSDRTIRICGDYKVTINPCLVVDQYPLPNPQDLFSVLDGGK